MQLAAPPIWHHSQVNRLLRSPKRRIAGRHAPATTRRLFCQAPGVRGVRNRATFAADDVGRIFFEESLLQTATLSDYLAADYRQMRVFGLRESSLRIQIDHGSHRHLCRVSS